jgi:hypothetical protein
MDMLSTVYNFVFGCHHNDVTRVFTIKDHSYKVCLDCGQQVEYSLQDMRPKTRSELREAARTALTHPHTATVINFSRLPQKVAPVHEPSNIAA